MDISIVVLNWNDREHLEICLDSIMCNSSKHSIEVIVVDNASTDGSAELVEKKFPGACLIKNPVNVGFPKGNNIGIRESTGTYVYVLNSDIKILGNCIDELADYMDAHPDIGMIGPKILNRDMTHQSSCRKFPSLWNNICSATGLARAFRKSKLFSGEHMFYFNGDRLIDVEVLVGCFWAVRKRALDVFGLLDEGFFLYAEDVDWCKRCWKAGWRVVFFPGAKAIHYMGQSSAKDPIRCAVIQQQSVLRYWQKHHGSIGKFLIGCIIFSHLLLRLCLTAPRGILNKSSDADPRVKIKIASACLHSLLRGGDRGALA